MAHLKNLKAIFFDLDGTLIDTAPDMIAVLTNIQTKEGQKPISQMTTIEAERYLNEGEFKKGSMAPKIKAALYFLKHYGEKVIITSIPSIKQAINGKAGTEIIKPEIS